MTRLCDVIHETLAAFGFPPGTFSIPRRWCWRPWRPWCPWRPWRLTFGSPLARLNHPHCSTILSQQSSSSLFTTSRRSNSVAAEWTITLISKQLKKRTRDERWEMRVLAARWYKDSSQVKSNGPKRVSYELVRWFSNKVSRDAASASDLWLGKWWEKQAEPTNTVEGLCSSTGHLEDRPI